MEERMTGMFAISKAGHDKGQMYVIIREEGDFVYLADGRSRTTDSPKRKKKKHLQLVKTDLDEDLMEKIRNQSIIYNEEIKYAIKVRMKKGCQK
ncbi:MAG: KOW domain-containing RNA-binding protein [Lachnospiraceae bacterium]|nr:KOW domain-containing RNA-binding protein [Lachnospiraceae bacterium]MDE6184413.1 KOW domain-containing RNA-binding protein [Lachnospiraceae bacterium]